MESDSLKRLQRLEDELALRHHIDKYHLFVDSFRFDEWAELFTEDTEFVLGALGVTISGRDKVVTKLGQGLQRSYEACQHVIANVRIELDGDKAALGYGNLIFTCVPKKSQPGLCNMSGARYQWRFVKEGSRWLTRRTEVESLWEIKNVPATEAAKVATAAKPD